MPLSAGGREGIEPLGRVVGPAPGLDSEGVGSEEVLWPALEEGGAEDEASEEGAEERVMATNVAT